MRLISRLPAAFATLAVAACGGNGSTPTVATPQPPAVVVTFASDSVRVEEGETVDITVRYRINSLSAPLSLAVSPLPLEAVPEDYELSATTFDIPAGQNVTGTASISLAALVDNQIAEGEEIVGLRLVPPGGIRAQLGENLHVTIADVGASPCAGVQVVATRIESLETTRYRRMSLELTHKTAAGAVWFDWGGPYLYGENCDDDECRMFWEENRSRTLEVNLVEWRMETSADGTSDVLDIEWNGSTTLRFGFRSAGGACEGQSTVACTAAGCELDQ